MCQPTCEGPGWAPPPCEGPGWAPAPCEGPGWAPPPSLPAPPPLGFLWPGQFAHSSSSSELLSPNSFGLRYTQQHLDFFLFMCSLSTVPDCHATRRGLAGRCSRRWRVGSASSAGGCDATVTVSEDVLCGSDGVRCAIQLLLVLVEKVVTLLFLEMMVELLLLVGIVLL